MLALCPRPRHRRTGAICVVLATALVALSCGIESPDRVDPAVAVDDATETATATVDPPQAPAEDRAVVPNEPSAPEAPSITPYVPGAAPGTGSAYSELVAELALLLDPDLRAAAPWPRLRDPDPQIAQIEIFEFWVWMAEFAPLPELVDVLAHPESPSRAEIVTVFSDLEARNHRERRLGAGYRVTQQQTALVDGTDLPLWFVRGAPDGSVVIWYSDQSGPLEILQADTGETLMSQPGTPLRDWVAILAPSDVGWQLWRDHLIEPGDQDFTTPGPQQPEPAQIEV